MMRTTFATLIGIASAATGLAVGYRLFARTACLTWGATAEEAERALPGDGLLADPDVVSTRAITIDATPEEVWPWLVQMGPGRGGAYTYDGVENLLGLDMHSADQILPEFQNLAVGDELPMGPTGPRLRVAILDRPQTMVLASTDHHWVWAFELYATGESTRLISRNRIATPGSSAPRRILWMLVMEPGSLVMERKMLLGIKQRAQRRGPVPATVTDGPDGQAESPYAGKPGERTLSS